MINNAKTVSTTHANETRLKADSSYTMFNTDNMEEVLPTARLGVSICEQVNSSICGRISMIFEERNQQDIGSDFGE